MILKGRVSFIFCFLISVFCRTSYGQLHSTGKITSYEKTAGGIGGKTEHGIFEITAYNDHTLRVRISQHAEFDNFNYALADPARKPWEKISLHDSGPVIELSTDAMHVRIKKEPSICISFYTREGKLISEDLEGAGFGTIFNGEKISLYRKLQESERFVGLGEALGNLDKRGMGITLNNTDNYKYGDPRIPMYISIPFFMGIHHDVLYGIYYNNSYKSFFNFGSSNNRFSSVSFDGGDLDYFFFYDDSIAAILEHYTDITGRMPMPPKWSIGYHQSRCSYFPQEEVMRIARTFRRKSIPIDCIVLDADYLQDYEPFRINKQRFPDMRGMADTLSKMNIELTASVNPGIKIDSTYSAHADGLKKDVFLKYMDGSLYEAVMEPSLNHWVDFTSPKGRAWWTDKMRFLPDNGIHGYWNDMNEPAVTGQSLPENLVFDFDGRKTFTAQAKNIYGMQMARASYEAALKFGSGRRPFVLTRSAFAGVQRYSAVWSGDNQAKDEFILSGCLLNSQMGLSGIPFTGPDLGGYIGDGNKELYKRWVEVGVFSPFVRNHREAYAQASEPWAYGEEAEAISKSYIEFRYRLLPYIYSTFYEASRTGMPIVRSLCLDFPNDSRVYDNLYQYQFMLGNALLIVPVTSQEKGKKIFLPEGSWYDLFTDRIISGNRELFQEFPVYQLPVYVKSASIIPMQRDVQSTRESPGDSLYLHVYFGDHSNSFTFYEDDGSTMEYSRGVYCRKRIEFDPGKKQLSISASEGSFKPSYRFIKIIFHGFADLSGSVRMNNQILSPTKSKNPVLDPLGYLAVIYDPAYLRTLREQLPMAELVSYTVPFSENAVAISW